VIDAGIVMLADGFRLLPAYKSGLPVKRIANSPHPASHRRKPRYYLRPAASLEIDFFYRFPPDR